MIREAIANYFNSKSSLIRARIENEKPCKHDWELIEKGAYGNKLNPNYTWIEYTYRCKKCCESKIISTKNYD